MPLQNNMDTSFYIFGAFTLGILHALSPGHGKAIVGAYLVGSKGRIIDAVLLGIIVTLTHTGGIILLGIAAVVASAYIMPEKVQQAASLISGILIFIVGGWLLYKRSNHAYQHKHNHRHRHEHNHPYASPSLGMLLALGVSGGIVPCPEALVVLLMAIGSGKILSGLTYVFIFSFGLASVLIAIGIILVKAGSLMQGFFKEGKTSKMARLLSIASAMIITLLGVYLIAQTGRKFF
ncbi:MAG: sulfite exporter TauE/SafE family protein [Nitrospirae bacterium]|nr:sulfite exporter TauE/SafE family protein [Nitrospirota bacterium]